jgi:hypothetical protein
MVFPKVKHSLMGNGWKAFGMRIICYVDQTSFETWKLVKIDHEV